MYTISRTYTFSAAHRIEGHPKCGRLHGHNYDVEVTLASTSGVGEKGMVMDYADLDDVVKPVIGSLDHRYLVSNNNSNANDPYAITAGILGDRVSLPIAETTAELLAYYLVRTLQPLLRVYLLTITVRETYRSTATCQLGPT